MAPGPGTHALPRSRAGRSGDDALAALRAEHGALLEAMIEGVVVQDAAGAIVLANRRAEEILGVPSEQLRGQTSVDRDPFCIRPDGSPFAGADHPAMRALRSAEPQVGVRMGVYQPDGDLRWISVNSRPLLQADDHSPYAVVTTFTDITDTEALTQQQAALRRVATAVAEGCDPPQVFALATRQVAALLRADAACIAKYRDEEHVVVTGACAAGGPAYGPGTVLATPPGGEFARLRATGQPARVARYEGDQQSRGRENGYGSSVIAPVTVAGRLWGGIIALSSREAGFDARAERQLTDFAGLLSLAIANADDRSRLAAQATTDPLTGLVNHRLFHERLQEEVARARRHGRSVALAVLDVDHFKTINDELGHEAGDRALTELARRLCAVARSEDVLARIGGDEFAWLMPDADVAGACAAVERARAAVAGTALADGHRVTLSAGLADASMADDHAELFRLADGALYWSKAHGRNASCVYDRAVVQDLSAAERAEHLRRSHALLGIRALARAIDAKDPATRQHSERVAGLAVRLAEQLGWGAEAVGRLREAALVHDVGKIGVPDAVLLKADRLTDEEYDTVKAHAALGAEIVADVLDPEQTGWVRGHHERPDGRGYPDGLCAEAVGQGAAVLALADAFDVMTSDRPYCRARPLAEALDECRRLSGSQFEPAVVDALLSLDLARED